jgi:pimeloyl-ACP methyl ester carboxylesterase
MRRRGLLVAGALLAGAATAWEVARRRDTRRLEEDPERAILDEPAQGEASVVTTPDGIDLHVETAGPPSAPTVVLVHGWGMSTHFWHYQIRDLPPDLRVVAYDRRGHGRSAQSEDGEYSLRAIAQDLDTVLRAQVPDGECAVLVGHSLGGMAILEWSRSFPDEVDKRIAGAVLVNTSAQDVTAGIFAGMAVAERVVSALGRRIIASRVSIPEASTPISTRLVRHIALSPSAAPAHVALSERLFFDCPADVRSGFGIALGRLDLEDAVRDLKVPTLVITGSRDRLVPPSFSQDLVEGLADGELVELEEAGHQTPLERHKEVTVLIRSHVHQWMDQAAEPTRRAEGQAVSVSSSSASRSST